MEKIKHILFGITAKHQDAYNDAKAQGVRATQQSAGNVGCKINVGRSMDETRCLQYRRNESGPIYVAN